MSDKRAAIIQLHRAGKTNSEIVKLLKAPRSTVYHTVSSLKNFKAPTIVLEVEDHDLLEHQR